jgi:hypothetical protein
MPYVRCSHERGKKRRTLAKKLCDYIRVPRCQGCGGREYRVDTFRHQVERKRKACTDWRCMYGFPHRRGSLLCIHHPNFEASAEAKWNLTRRDDRVQ